VHGLEPGGDVANFPRSQRLDGFHAGSEDADLDGTHVDFGGEHAQDVIGFERAFDDADVGDDALVGVVMRIEDEGAQGRVILVLRRRDALDDGFEDLVHVEAILGGDLEHVRRVDAQQGADILRHLVGARGGQVDLVDDGDDDQVGFERLVQVGEGLRFDALRGIHHEDGPFAGLEGAADLVAEVHVAGRVDQVDLVFLPSFAV
jgi:hypothetical protein